MALRIAAPPATASRPSTAGLLPVSVLATLSLLVLPGATVALGSRAAGVPLTGPMGWLVTGLVSLAYMLAGAKLWARHPRSNNLSWGELVLWSWARRRRAEGTLERGAELLDDDARELLDPQGRRAQVKVLRELNAALEVRDPYTRGHSRRVERHAHRIALALRCSDDDIFDIRLAASLHDVGKIKVPDRILRKDGALDESEWAIMKQHSEVGAELLQRLGNHAVVAAVRSHHERWDGRGYPEGLAGTAIPLGARIIAVADTFDAITSCRPYRDRADRARAVSVLKSEAGQQFDPAVVSAFLSTTPHQAAAFAGVAALVAPLARKLASQWGVVFNKVGAVSLAGTMTASAFTGVAAVERPLSQRLEEKQKAAAPADPASEDAQAGASEGAPSPRGNAFGHDKKAHAGGNGKSHAGGNGKSKSRAGEATAADAATKPTVGGNGKGNAFGHDKKAHAGGNGKSNAGGKGKSKAGGAAKPEKAAAPPSGPKADSGETTDEPAAEPAASAPPPAPAAPKPAKPAPVEPAPEPEAPPVAPAPEPAEDKGKGKPK